MNKNPPSRALVIVDMQDYFLGNLSELYTDHKDIINSFINNIIKQIKWATKNRLPIVCLEYDDLEYEDDGYSAVITNKVIQEHLNKYPLKWYAKKDTDTGYDEVMDVLCGIEPRKGLRKGKLQKLISKKTKMTFRVCGVNLHACVRDTVSDMIQFGHNVEIVHGTVRNVYDDESLLDYESPFDNCIILNQKESLVDNPGILVESHS